MMYATKDKDTFKMVAYNERKHTHDLLYRDQMTLQKYSAYGWTMTAVYTETGIKRIDSWLANQITSTKTDPKKIAKMIRCNPHLHNVLKTNLLQNLKVCTGFDGFDKLEEEGKKD